MSRPQRSMGVLFVSAMLGGIIASAAGTGYAGWYRQGSCSGEPQNASASSSLSCLIPDSTGLTAKADIDDLNVHVYDGTTNARVRGYICIQAWDSTSVWCSTGVKTGGASTGVDDLHLPRTWYASGGTRGLTNSNGHDADFGTVEVYLPGNSRLLGVYYHW